MKFKDTEIRGMYLILRALLTRYQHRMERSLTAEFIDGFDHHTLETLFGASWPTRTDIYGEFDSECLFYQFGKLPGDETLDGLFDSCVYNFCFVIWEDIHGSRSILDRYRQNSFVRAVYELVALDEYPGQANRWIQTLFDEYRVYDYTRRDALS